jgi:hypothetical protein
MPPSGLGACAAGPSGGVFASELIQDDRGEATVFIPVTDAAGTSSTGAVPRWLLRPPTRSQL